MKYNKFLSKMLFVALFTTLSCNKESDQLLSSKETRSIGVNARSSKEGYDFKNSKITPIAEGAVYLKNFVEVPYLLEGKLPRPKAQTGSVKKQGRERLLISTRGAEFKMYVVRYIPSPSFKGDINKVNSENFREYKFDGLISLRKVGEEDFETWKIQNGKVIKQSKVTKTNNKKNGRVNSNYVCVQWEQDTDWYQLDGGEAVYLYTTTEYGEDCYWEDDGGSGGGYVEDPCIDNPGHPLCGGTGSGEPSFDDYMNDPTYAQFLEGLNAAERAWFKQHPTRIGAAWANRVSAESNAEQKFKDGNGDNHNANAFKHALWSGLNTLSWGANAARELGQAHETTFASENSRTMDLHNNELGIRLANQNGQQMTEDILNAISNGQGLRLSDPSDYNSSLIPTDGTGRK